MARKGFLPRRPSAIRSGGAPTRGPLGASPPPLLAASASRRIIRKMPEVTAHAAHRRRRPGQDPEPGPHLREAHRRTNAALTQKFALMHVVRRKNPPSLPRSCASPWRRATSSAAASPPRASSFCSQGPDLAASCETAPRITERIKKMPPARWTWTTRWSSASPSWACSSTAARAADLGVQVARRGQALQLPGGRAEGLVLLGGRRAVRRAPARRRANSASMKKRCAHHRALASGAGLPGRRGAARKGAPSPADHSALPARAAGHLHRQLASRAR
jgi:hypothetical protein